MTEWEYSYVLVDPDTGDTYGRGWPFDTAEEAAVAGIARVVENPEPDIPTMQACVERRTKAGTWAPMPGPAVKPPATHRPLVVHDRFVTVELDDAPARVINDWITAHRDELDAELAPHGVSLSDISVPDYQRIVYRDEVATESA